MNLTPIPLPNILKRRNQLPHYNHVKQQQHEQHIKKKQEKLPEQQHMKNDGKLPHHERLLAREHEDEKTCTSIFNFSRWIRNMVFFTIENSTHSH